MTSFKPYLDANIQTEKPIIHISLNPHPDNAISQHDYSQIAQEYMERMGYGEQPYVVFLHEDIDRKHLHIVSTRVNIDGRKLDHNYERRKSDGIRLDLMKEYGLSPTNKGRKSIALPKSLDYERSNVKAQIKSITFNVLEQYKFGSITDLNAILNCFNVSV